MTRPKLLAPLLRILALWRGRKALLGLGLAVSLASLAAGVALLPASLAVLLGVAAGLPFWLQALGGTRVALRYAERMVTHDATFRALADLRVWFFRGLAQRAAGGLGFREAGDLLARLVADIEALDGLYLRIVVPLAGGVLLLPVVVFAGWRVAPVLGLGAGLLFVAATLLLPIWAARRAAESGVALAEAGAALRIAALDGLTGLREVRAFGAEAAVTHRVLAREATLLECQNVAGMRAALAQAGALLCGQLALALILTGALTGAAPAKLAVAAFLTVAAFEAVAGLPRAGSGAGYAAAAAARVLATAEGPPAVPEPARPAALSPRHDLRFDAVHFRWSPERAPVFDGLTLDIPAGARVALLGPSGAGKSTLAALALKVAVPQAGTVRLGGVDLATLSADAVRGKIAWLGQATHLFDDTVRANLRLGRPQASEAELWAALDQAALGDMVRALPERLDTWLGEGGARISGGQGRRLALARALISEAPILILDEPCASLDAETEREFLATLASAAPGRTVILITHRLTGVERLDRIYRLSAGHAVAAAA